MVFGSDSTQISAPVTDLCARLHLTKAAPLVPIFLRRGRSVKTFAWSKMRRHQSHQSTHLCRTEKHPSIWSNAPNHRTWKPFGLKVCLPDLASCMPWQRKRSTTLPEYVYISAAMDHRRKCVRIKSASEYPRNNKQKWKGVRTPVQLAVSPILATDMD